MNKKAFLGLAYGMLWLVAASADETAQNPLPNTLFETLAKTAPRGRYPKYFYGEQTYFTVVGSYDSNREALLNEEGALEIDRGGFSIEPFLYADNHLITWADAAISQDLESSYLPIPSVSWQWKTIHLKTTAYATDTAGSALYARYRVENTGIQPQHIKLLLAVRPFQVNPPWQSLNMTGGVAPIQDIAFDGKTIRVNGDKTIIPLTPPQNFGVQTFAAGSIVDQLAASKFPQATTIHDPSGYASAALEYDLDLAPGASRNIYLAIPQHNPEALLNASRNNSGFGNNRFREAVDFWETKLNHAEFVGPASRLSDAVRANLAYLLIHRDGPALYPGSRTYARSWIRDSAVMISALLGMGYTDEDRQFIRWYAGFQFVDGKIPCCVDYRGPDSVPENDSHGEFIYAVAEYYRFTRDIGFVRELWPKLVKAVEYIETLRQQRLTQAYQAPDKREFFGLMPESISHEGYAAHPVHAYWDDFWTLRGFKDAAELAELVMDDTHAAQFGKSRDDFARDLYASINRTIAKYKTSYVPASADLGDFDINATSMILNIIGEQDHLPPVALKNTFDEYRAYFMKRRTGQIPWDAYTPYEIRNVEALVRLGRRDEAWELLEFLLADQRPAAWKHWAEVVWRDAKAPKFIGDMPHAWIGAEFVRAVRALYVYERDGDRALVLAAGIPKAWLDGAGGIGVKRLPTWFGTLNYRLWREGANELRLSVTGDVALPPGKMIVKPPADRPLRAVWINGKRSRAFTADAAVVGEFPAEVVLRY